MVSHHARSIGEAKNVTFQGGIPTLINGHEVPMSYFTQEQLKRHEFATSVVDRMSGNNSSEISGQSGGRVHHMVGGVTVEDLFGEDDYIENELIDRSLEVD